MHYSKHLCHRYQHAMEILGKRWTGLIIKVLLEGPQRFNKLADQLDVVSDRMLSERLKELEAEGVVERRVLPDPPIQVEYRLTEKGHALAPVVAAVERWSADWIPTTR